MTNKPSAPTLPVLNPFIEKHQKDVIGILHCLDRVRLQGSLRYLYRKGIFEEYLHQAKVLYKDFKKFATGITAEICQRAEQFAQGLRRPFTYLPSSKISKEDAARQIVKQDQVKEGLVAVFRCVEPCRTYVMRGNYQTKLLEPRLEWGKCLHLYFYVQHPRYGLIHLRLQTWFPFLIHIGFNGHDWLARQMEQQGLRFHQADNRFTWIEDWEQAQSLADAQLHTDWEQSCEQLRELYHPLYEKIAAPFFGGRLSYYWTAPQTEYATDVAFRDQATVERLFPRLVLHGMLNLGCEQVMRFLGKQLNRQFQGEVVGDLRRHPEGLRLKHYVNKNSVKIYSRFNLIRVETTIHDAEDLKVYRSPECQPWVPKRWYPLRRGVVDLPRRVQISKGANLRYLTAFAPAHEITPLAQEAVKVCRPVRQQGRRYRALNPFAEGDAVLLTAVNRGEWAFKGFRNRELRLLLFGEPNNQRQARAQAAKVTRRLALLRAHGLVSKVSRTQRWQVTDKGRRILSALLAARQADTEKLISLAA